MRQAHRALILVPLLMAAALLGSVVASTFTVRSVLATLARGQGDALLDSLRRGTGDDTDPEFLRRLLTEQEPEGLRCIAVFELDLTPAAVVGDCWAEDAGGLLAALESASSDEVVDLGERVRMVRGGGAATALSPAQRSRHPLLVEFEPLMTRDLERGALRSLGIGGAASLALVVVAIWLWRLSRRQEKLQQKMERDRHLASLGEMAAVLAHEIRNPLASMKGHAQLLAEQLGDGSREKEKAGRVVNEAKRLEELTADLLSFVRSKQIEPRPSDPRQVVAAAAREVAGAEHPEEIALDDRAAPASWSLDPGLLQRALVNLLRNAVQASNGDGANGAGARDGWAALVSLAEEDGELVIAVRDRGPGVPIDDRQRIFEPFYTTRLRGTGLGLAVAQRIVDLHGGAITTGDHPEGGALFTVRLPRRPG